MTFKNKASIREYQPRTIRPKTSVKMEKGTQKSKRQHTDTRIQRNAKPENNLIHYILKENKHFAPDVRRKPRNEIPFSAFSFQEGVNYTHSIPSVITNGINSLPTNMHRRGKCYSFGLSVGMVVVDVLEDGSMDGAG